MNKSVEEDKSLRKAKSYAHAVYKIAKQFPKDELFGLTSQLRRSALSVPLNIVEGYARQSTKTQLQFLKISFGSLKESQFLLQFAYDETYVTSVDAQNILNQGDELAKMLWVKIQTLAKKPN